MYSLSAFKTYDIRGIWQSEVDEKFGLILGYALGLHLREKYTTPRVLISSDVREANNILIDEFLKGMKSAGIEEVTVIGYDEKNPQYRFGVCSTPIAYYAVIDTFDCACVFTASHNPGEYVGAKIVDRQCLSIKSHELREIFEASEKTEIPLN